MLITVDKGSLNEMFQLCSLCIAIPIK